MITVKFRWKVLRQYVATLGAFSRFYEDVSQMFHRLLERVKTGSNSARPVRVELDLYKRNCINFSSHNYTMTFRPSFRWDFSTWKESDTGNRTQ